MTTFDLTKEYNRDDFLEYLTDFLPDDFEQKTEQVYADYKTINTGIKIGTCNSLDLVAFEFETKLNSESDPRVSLTREVCSVMKNKEASPNALVIFYSKQSQKFRLSLITTDYVIENNKVKTEYSNPRRFSFKLGKDCKTHTPAQMLFEKGRVNNIEELKSRFSIESVTKQFYNELFAWYEWACTLVTFPKGSTNKVGNKFDVVQTKDNNELNLIRLITRIMFVWFIKQKDLIPSWIFDKEELKKVLADFESKTQKSAKKGNYYNAIIQNLFFATLNKKIGERQFTQDDSEFHNKQFGIKTFYRDNKTQSFFTESQKQIVERFKPVPFLNGGLFECLDKLDDNDTKTKNIQIFTDGFTRNPDWMAFVPNCLFWNEETDSHEGLISLLNRYNFTVEENTPTDVQVALDPELLGKVFENLLGSFNPETSETARKDSGSFYTPREIVQYMVDESLKAYLKEYFSKTKTITEETINTLFNDQIEGLKLQKEKSDEITKALKNIKVLDPACGSGAFPMGMLQRIVHIIQKCNDIYDNKSLYNLKLEIIEKCLYGSDIQSIAVQICKLRFFISLICEQEKTDKIDDNYGFNPLPNLETKFVAANSLVGSEINKFSDDWSNNEELTNKKNELLKIRHKHFTVPNAKEKAQCRNDDRKIREELAIIIQKSLQTPNSFLIKTYEDEIQRFEKLLESVKEECWVDEIEVQQDLFGETPKTLFKIDKNKELRDNYKKQINQLKTKIEFEKHKVHATGFEGAVTQLAEWNPYNQNEVAKFFDAEWMFGITDGFDIVIGNPPYVQLQKDGGKLGKLYEKSGFTSYIKTGDIYQLFYEKGTQLLKENAHLCFITSNKWMRAGYGEKSREYFAKNTNPKLLIDFAGTKIFESATVDTNILLLQKATNKGKTICCVTKKLTQNDLNNLSNFVKTESSISNFTNSDSWVILNSIEQSIKNKIESVGTPLKDWDINIYRGVLTGYNEAFIINTQKRDEILLNCKTKEEREKTAELIRPILRGRDIKRYSYDWANLWLINTHNGIKGKLERIHIEDYPAVKTHLDEYWDKIESRADQGDTPYNLRNCAYMEDFFKPKICWAELARTGNSFFLDENCYEVIAGVFLMTMSDEYIKKYGYEYLTMYLNCPLSLFLFDMIYSKLDETGWQWKKEPIEKLYVPRITKNKQKNLLTLWQELKDSKQLSLKQEICAKISLEIYKLLDLSEEQIEAIYSRTKVFNTEWELIKGILK